MSNLIFKLETLNPNLRTTFFKHKNYTEYLAYSEYAIKNNNVDHGLFGIINRFSDIENMESVNKISEFITDLADRKIPIYRGVISLKEYDASRLGYLEKEKWKELLESKLPSIASKLNIKYSDIQYVGAVHLEDGHPHLQFMLWSKSRDKSNYYVKAEIKNKLRKEFTNAVFREDLLPIYQEKDLAKKNITSENYILNELKKVVSDEKTLKELIKYEKEFKQTRIIRALLKDNDVKQIVDLLIDLKKELSNTTGSIKYQYLNKYPEIIEKIDNISNIIIDSSIQCQTEINKYIKAKQKLLEFQYSDSVKLEEEKNKVKQETEKEVIKLIGNQILDIERKWLNSKEDYNNTRYNNESRNLLDNILTALYFQTQNQKKLNRNYEIRYKKQLSKQAKKELALKNRNASSFDWEDEIY